VHARACATHTPGASAPQPCPSQTLPAPQSALDAQAALPSGGFLRVVPSPGIAAEPPVGAVVVVVVVVLVVVAGGGGALAEQPRNIAISSTRTCMEASYTAADG